MAQALKVGDRVRIITNPYSHLIPQVQPGDEFTVARVRPGIYPYELEGVQRPSGSRWGFKAHEVEKIDPEPKFQVGDRVRRDDGVEGTVVRVRPNHFDDQRKFYPFLLRMDTSTRYEFEHRFEKVEPVPFRLERGDRVVNIKTGREGEVIHDLVFDTKPPFGKPVPVEAIEEYEEHHAGTYDLIKRGAPW